MGARTGVLAPQMKFWHAGSISFRLTIRRVSVRASCRTSETYLSAEPRGGPSHSRGNTASLYQRGPLCPLGNL